MNKNFRARSAFSLIEISIVILIIGILIAGVTQSSRLVAKSRFSNARTLTQSSPVASIKNLTLWLETTSEQSILDAETEANTDISTWYDLNPQTSIRANFAIVTTGPSYQTNSAGNVNSLPTLNFDSSNEESMSTANFGNIINGASVFLVVKTPSSVSSTAQAILGKRTAGTAAAVNFEVKIINVGWKFCDVASSAESCYSSTSSALTGSKPYIVSIVYTPNTSDTGVSFYQNGTAMGSATTGAPNTSVTDNLYIGQSGLTATPAYFDGNLGEVIIYDRYLKDEERQAVEAYLGQKWGITMAVAS